MACDWMWKVNISWAALMERKSLILILLALCVLFILEEEVFHFDTFSTRPAVNTHHPKNLTHAHRSPSSSFSLSSSSSSSLPEVRRRPLAFVRSRNHYEGGGRGLEDIVQEELDRRRAIDYDNSNSRRNGNSINYANYGGRGGSRELSDSDTRQWLDGNGLTDDATGEESDDDYADDDWIEEDDGGDEESAPVEDDSDYAAGDDHDDDDDDGVDGNLDVGVGEEMQTTFEFGDDKTEEEKLKTSPFIYREEEENLKTLEAAKYTDIKYISYYLPWEALEHDKHNFRLCRYTNCAFVNNMSLADLVVFKASAIRDHPIPSFYRPRGQRWLMYTADPATKKYAFSRPDVISSFNWTMTYQLDADAPRIFGRLKKQALPDRAYYDKLFDNKPRSTAWFVSHCITWSKRENYVARMQKVMDVDIFGDCGNLTCGVSNKRAQDKNLCLPMLTNEYKFYLSFENSFCPDYITEKFFKLFQHIQVIPVVRGGFKYKKYLPNGIFVDASDFKTPEALAKYLIDLGNDKERYVEMLRQKDSWRYVSVERRHCGMCEKLNTHWNEIGHHPNLRVKFNGIPAACWSPKEGSY